MMECPFCEHDETWVTDTRNGGKCSIRRRRECRKCEQRFTTYEIVEGSGPTDERPLSDLLAEYIDILNGSELFAERDFLREHQGNTRLIRLAKMSKRIKSALDEV